ERAHDDEAAAEAPPEEGAAEGEEDADAGASPGLRRVEREELDGEGVLARVALADEGLGAGVEVLLGAADGLRERGRRRAVEDADAGPGPLRHLDAEEACGLVARAGAHRPRLPRRERVRPDLALVPELRRRHELLDAVGPHLVAEPRG